MVTISNRYMHGTYLGLLVVIFVSWKAPSATQAWMTPVVTCHSKTLHRMVPYSAPRPSLEHGIFDDDDDLERGDAFLAPNESWPPKTADLLHQLTWNYQQAMDQPNGSNATSLISNTTYVVDLIRSDHRIYPDAPVDVGGQTSDNQTLAVLLSWAALYSVPQAVVVHWLRSLDDTSVTAVVDRLEAYGWQGTQFPNGLAVSTTRRPWRRQRRIQQAEDILVVTQQSVPPRRSVQELRQVLTQTQLVDDRKRGMQLPKVKLNYFPANKPFRKISWRRLQRSMDQQYATLKRKGRAGLVAYAVFNFLFYTIGMTVQWHRLAPGDPVASSVASVLVRKWGRVFGSLYVVSNLLKIPKLFVAVGLASLSERVLRRMTRRLKVSETTASVLLVGSLVATWAGILAVPVAREYGRLRHLVQLERALHHV